MEKQNLSHIFNGSEKWYNYFGTQLHGFLQRQTCSLHMTPAIPLLGIWPKREKKKTTYVHTETYTATFSSFLLNGQKLKIIQMFFNWCMGKQTLEHQYNGILFSNYINMDESQMHYANRKKPDSKQFHLWHSAKGKSTGTQNRLMAGRGCGVRGEVLGKETEGICG